MDTLPAEIGENIIGCINCGSDYKSVCLINTDFLSYAKNTHPDADIKFANHLVTILTMIDCGNYLPRGYESREQFIGLLPASAPFGNPNLALEFIDSHPDWPKYLGALTCNPNVTTKWLEAHQAGFSRWIGGPWSIMSPHPCVTIDYICARPHLTWDVQGLSRNPTITPEVIDARPEIPWDLRNLLRNPNTTWEFITLRKEEFKQIPGSLSRWSRLTIENVLEYLDWEWSWNYLTEHPNMTMEIIESHPELPWERNSIIRNPNVTIDYVLKHPDLPWDWRTLTINPNMTVNVIKARPELSWKTSRIYKNPKFTWGDVEKYPNGVITPWNYRKMGSVPGLTWKKIIELDHAGTEWDWIRICRNKFNKCSPELL